MNEKTVEGLAGTVQSWLDFQISCNRKSLLSESYLAQPIGEYLQAHHSGKIQLEWTIPSLQQNTSGRPRQLDYALFSRDKNRIVTAIEAKWVGSSVRPQRIIDDLLRLEFVRSDPGQSVNRFFMVAGLDANFNRYFKHAQVNSAGVRCDFLSKIFNFQKLPFRVSVYDSSDPWKKHFKSFAESHKVVLPKTFTTKCVAHVKGSFSQVGIWRVSSVSNRATILSSVL